MSIEIMGHRVSLGLLAVGALGALVAIHQLSGAPKLGITDALGLGSADPSSAGLVSAGAASGSSSGVGGVGGVGGGFGIQPILNFVTAPASKMIAPSLQTIDPVPTSIRSIVAFGRGSLISKSSPRAHQGKTAEAGPTPYSPLGYYTAPSKHGGIAIPKQKPAFWAAVDAGVNPTAPAWTGAGQAAHRGTPPISQKAAVPQSKAAVAGVSRKAL